MEIKTTDFTYFTDQAFGVHGPTRPVTGSGIGRL